MGDLTARSRVAAAVLGVVLALASAEWATAFEVTEGDHPRCASYEKYRQPFFGTTHLHTGLSFDATIRLIETTPRDAYRFAKGESTITLPDLLGFQKLVVQIDRPTDWGAVTDHSEQFGEIGICKGFLDGHTADGRTAAVRPDVRRLPQIRVVGDNLRYSLECRLLNAFYWTPESSIVPQFQRTSASSASQILSLPSDGPSSFNSRLPVCVNNPATCDRAELAVWEEEQAAAEEEYDHSDRCSFTTFVGYEVTSTPNGQNWHRNVIFRNDRVVKRPITAIDMARQPNPNPQTKPPLYAGAPDPVRLWDGLARDCLDGKNVTSGRGTRCDVLTIPHNSNLGGGEGLIPPLFYDPVDTEEATKRAAFEPLVEIYQDKGSSECRYDPRFQEGVETRDEFCSFELLDTKSVLAASGIGGASTSGAIPPSEFNPRSQVRNVLKDGLVLADRYDGVNPFKLGIVASSDHHNGVMGWHPENASWTGHLGIEDVRPTRSAGTIQNSSGGHSVVWAEENSRDSIFEALKRKETYGTSGTRPIVRFFGGWGFDQGLCATNFVPTGYEEGVPMGGDLPPRPDGAGGPRFIAAAWMDDFVGTPLEQVQIIKGWVTPDGTTQEKVVRVAGIPGDAGHPEAGVTQSCEPLPPLGAEQLCAVWQDPDFDPAERAFYYVRVLERPVCRYSTLICQQQFGLNPFDLEQCEQDLTAMQMAGDPRAANAAACCSDQTTVPIVQPAIQERAWTSPIWYTPAS
jgi:Protein of unknown function (DUF3604)